MIGVIDRFDGIGREGGTLWIARLDYEQQPALIDQFEEQLGGRLARSVRGELWYMGVSESGELCFE